MAKLIVLALALGMVASPIHAASQWVKGAATFERKIGSDQAILGGESVWLCAGSTCRGRVPVHLKSAQRYCRQLARWGGSSLVSFEAGGIVFDAEALRYCNGAR